MDRIDLPSQFDGKAYGIVIAGHFQTDDTYITSRPQGMDDWLIAFTLSGQGYFVTPGGKKICSGGDVSLLKPGTPHVYGTEKNQSWNFVWAHFSSRHIEEKLLPVEELSIQTFETGSVRKRAYRAFRRIISDSRERGEYWHELCLEALREILMLLAQRRNQKLDPRIEEALHYLSQNMRQSVRIDALAKSVGLSPSRLSHMFKEYTGLSVIDSLNKMRIRQAALLLEHTGRSAAEAAYDVGFQNYNHFINQFRKWYGVNPSTFKKNVRHRTSGLKELGSMTGRNVRDSLRIQNRDDQHGHHGGHEQHHRP
ncbi:helix-turn-helix domain-containing protein [Paenibacillus alkalitolerans]|uniref:helix-turn-helix domain-containing protein n=1 Tax=Paenibacillus alkalitolerans TaxID=2799335 RepID=UPI0018F4E745|nr:helix-turn-helix domain-containing protein [Paenibacillus alkalitolerans]